MPGIGHGIADLDHFSQKAKLFTWFMKYVNYACGPMDISDNRSLGSRDRNDIPFQNMKRYNKSVSFVEKERI
jgi:hypothetical protein